MMRAKDTRAKVRPRRLAYLPILLLVALVAGCASGGGLPKFAGLPDRELQWPALPNPPRIAWVKDIRDFRDLGIRRGFWQRTLELFTGETDARIGKPYGIFVDQKDRLFIVDVGFAVVHQMDLKEKSYSIIGEGSEFTFRTPIGVTEDDQDNLYISDAGTGIIHRYAIGDKTLTPFTLDKLGRPTGIVFNVKNRLIYVSDTANHQIVILDLSGKVRHHIGMRGTGPGQFNYPTDLFIDAKGRLYVTDALNARIQIFTADGTFVKQFGRPGDSSGSFAKPKGVAVDSDGHIYVSDAMFDAVQIFNESGRVLLDFGEHGSNSGQFWMPAGVFIDKDDFVYVADSYNRRVQVFKYLKVDDKSEEALVKAPGAKQ